VDEGVRRVLHRHIIDLKENETTKALAVGNEYRHEITGESLGVIENVEEISAGTVRVMAAVYSYHE